MRSTHPYVMEAELRPASPDLPMVAAEKTSLYISNERRLRSLALELLGTSLALADNVLTVQRELTALRIARGQESQSTVSPKPERREWRSLPPPRLGPPASSGNLRAMTSRIGGSTSTSPKSPPCKRRSSNDRRRKGASLDLGAMPRSKSNGSAASDGEELRT